METRHVSVVAILLMARFCTIPPLAIAQRAVDETERSTTTRAGVEVLIRNSGGEAAVAFRPLDGNQTLFINAGDEFPATNEWVEIPVAIALHAEVQARTLRLEDTVLAENRFRSAADGSVFHLDPALDHDPELYKKIGRRVSLRELETRMMKQNSQLATNLLIGLLDLAQINGRLADLRASGIRLRHGFQDLKAERAGERNTVSARGMMEVLWSLATGNAISTEASKEIVGLIANARTASSGPFAANPSGSAPGDNYQEAVIVYGAHSFALAVVVHGLKSGTASAALIAKISRALAAAN